MKYPKDSLGTLIQTATNNLIEGKMDSQALVEIDKSKTEHIKIRKLGHVEKERLR